MASSSVATPSSERASSLAANLTDVNAKISQTQAVLEVPRPVTLLAVSKLKPASDILACYNASHRDFGENYINDLVEKASQLPQDIRWHFIGTLQSNKAKTLAGVPNLYAIQTLTSKSTATAINKALPATRTEPLNVLLQVNTSGEASKSGLPPLDVHNSDPDASELDSTPLLSLATHILTFCPRLHLLGLMTIGSWEASHSNPDLNPDFEGLRTTRDLLENELKSSCAGSKWGKEGKLLLSMGMSADFEAAIKAGSDIVRVGSTIFGERPTKQ